MKSDLINRQAAIDAIEKHLNGVFDGTHYDEGIAYGYEAAHRHIQDLINALQPAQQWIPVSERLPEHEVLCCDKRGEMMIGYPFYDGDSDTGFSAESENEFMYSCVAWMPLPEPYREETEDATD